MRGSVLGFQSGRLLRGAAVGMFAVLGAGCSSDFSRFAPYDSVSTGSVNQQQIIHKKQAPAAPQAFPDDLPAARSSSIVGESVYDEPVYTGSVENGVIKPAKRAVKKSTLAPVAAAGAPVKKAKQAIAPVSAARQAVEDDVLVAPATAKPAAAPKKIAVAPTDETTTSGVAPKGPRLKPSKQPMPDAKPVKQAAAKSAKEPTQEGWSTIGGTWITVKDGETVYNLAKRFGVPANAILEANGLSSASALQAGKKVIIPTYIYSNTAKISAPDANAETQLAKSSRGNVTDVDDNKVPLPGKTPVKENVAVLPSVPAQKAKKTAEVAAAADTAVKAAAPAKPAASAPGTYTVASGDSLYVIAKKTGSSVDAIKAANGMADAKLKIGQVLSIPAAGAKPTLQVAAAEPSVDPVTTSSAVTAPTKPKAAQEPVEAAAPSNAVIEEAEKDTAAAPSATGISKLRWPVRGRTLVSYGQSDAGRVNDGVDISVPVGTPVKAAENGVVIYAGTGLKDFGNTVLIRHENGMVTVYGHNGDLSVKRGQSIKRGQEIARSGMSGATKVPKLHFEVRKNSKPVNPATYLE